MLKRPPRIDGLREGFKSLIDKPQVQDILEPVNDNSDKIFIPDGGYMAEPMNFSYWSRIVLLIRENLFAQDEDFHKAISAPVQVRVDIMPPEESYKVNTAMQAIHERVYLAAERQKVPLERAKMEMPFFRVSRPMNSILTEEGYYTASSIFKTVLGSYE